MHTQWLLLLQILSQWVIKHQTQKTTITRFWTITSKCMEYYFEILPLLATILLLLSLACEKIQLSTCLQLYHLAVAIVPPVVRAPQFEKGCAKRCSPTPDPSMARASDWEAIPFHFVACRFECQNKPLVVHCISCKWMPDRRLAKCRDA